MRLGKTVIFCVSSNVQTYPEMERWTAEMGIFPFTVVSSPSFGLVEILVTLEKEIFIFSRVRMLPTSIWETVLDSMGY